MAPQRTRYGAHRGYGEGVKRSRWMPRGTSAMHTFPAIVDYTILCVSPAAFEAIAGLRLLTLPTGFAPARRCNGFGTGAARY